jgi:DNA-binding beta-propeller fold protein YncE
MSLDINRNAVLDECEDCDGNEVTDIVELAGSHDVWVGHAENFIKSFEALTGVEVVSSDAGSIPVTNDLVINQESGRILVSTESRVAEFNRQGQFVGDFVASGAGGLGIATGMAFTSSGNLLVGSLATDSVLEYDGATGAFVGEFVAAGAGGLFEPFGLHFDARKGGTGNLFVTTGDNRVLEYDGATGAFVGEFVAANSGGLTIARGLLFNPVTGNLLVASFDTDQVLEYDGQTGAFVDQWNRGGTSNRLTLDNPYQIRLGRDGDIYVSRFNEDESAGGGGTGALHLTNASIYHFRAENGYFMRAYVLGLNAGLHHPTGFDFYPDFGSDCNFNRVPDNCDIASGFSQDLNGNGVPDECEEGCYADCDGNATLDVFDFLCFQDAFVQGDPYADCDGNTVLDVFDFLCFQDAFVIGCP